MTCKNEQTELCRTKKTPRTKSAVSHYHIKGKTSTLRIMRLPGAEKRLRRRGVANKNGAIKRHRFQQGARSSYRGTTQGRTDRRFHNCGQSGFATDQIKKAKRLIYYERTGVGLD